MEPPTSHVTTAAFSDSDSASVEGDAAAADAADVKALCRLSDNLAAAFRSADEFTFLANARLAVPGGAPDLRVNRCVLSARRPFLHAVFARHAAGLGLGPGAKGDRAELRELLGNEVEVGYEALLLVLKYLYSDGDGECGGGLVVGGWGALEAGHGSTRRRVAMPAMESAPREERREDSCLVATGWRGATVGGDSPIERRCRRRSGVERVCT